MFTKIRFVLPLFFVSLFWASSCSLLPSGISPSGSAKKIVAYLADSLGVDSCLVGQGLPASGLPASADSLIQAQYPQDNIVNVTEFTLAGYTSYQVSLASGTQLLFDDLGNLVVAGNPSTLLDDSDAKAFAKALLSQHFPGLDLDDLHDVSVKLDSLGGFSVSGEWDDDLYMTFTFSNNSVCYEYDIKHGKKGKKDDDDDDDDHDHGGTDFYNCGQDSLPASVDSLILAEYGSKYSIDKVFCDSLCDGTDGFWVELKGRHGAKPNKYWLFFDLAGQWLVEVTEYKDDDDLPGVIEDAFGDEFPGDEIEESFEWQWIGGDLAYLVEGETTEGNNDDDEYLALFADDGTLLCVWEEEWLDGQDD